MAGIRIKRVSFVQSMGCREFIGKELNSKSFKSRGLKAMRRVRNFLIIIKIEPSCILIYMLGDLYPWLEMVLR